MAEEKEEISHIERLSIEKQSPLDFVFEQPQKRAIMKSPDDLSSIESRNNTRSSTFGGVCLECISFCNLANCTFR